MTLSLQRRLMLSFAPLIAVIAALGGSGLYLMNRLGNASNEILRENYDSWGRRRPAPRRTTNPAAC